jgi:hypothetical protein
MALDEAPPPGDQHARTGGSPPDVEARTIDTSDSCIETTIEHLSNWNLHPDATTNLETTRVSDADLLRASGVRTACAQPPAPQVAAQPDEDMHVSAPAASGQKQKPSRKGSSMWKQLVITGAVALVCGVAGAMGYAYAFGGKVKEAAPDQSQSKSDPGSKKLSISATKSLGGQAAQTDNESKAQVAGTKSKATVQTPAQAALLMQQVKDLTQRVDNLRGRVEELTRPIDETPPVLRMMQIKINTLAHEIANLSALPAACRQFDNRLEAFKEELEALRTQTSLVRAGPVAGRTPDLILPSAPTREIPAIDPPVPPQVLFTTPTASQNPSGAP